MSNFNIENTTETTPLVIEEAVTNLVENIEESVEVKDAVVEAPVVETPKVDPIKIEPKVSSKNIILYSLKDINISGLGSLKKGYNSVQSSKADKWLEKNSVRLATQEEINVYFK